MDVKLSSYSNLNQVAIWLSPLLFITHNNPYYAIMIMNSTVRLKEKLDSSFQHNKQTTWRFASAVRLFYRLLLSIGKVLVNQLRSLHIICTVLWSLWDKPRKIATTKLKLQHEFELTFCRTVVAKKAESFWLFCLGGSWTLWLNRLSWRNSILIIVILPVLFWQSQISIQMKTC